MHQRRRWLAGVTAAAFLCLAAATAALGYSGQVAGTIALSGPAGNVSCGTSSTVHAHILDTNGNPFTGEIVIWSFNGGNISGDKFTPASSTTDSSGNATTSVTFACPSSSTTSNRVVDIQGVSGEAVGSLAITVTVKGLPSTSTDPVGGTSTAAVLAAALAVLLGGWIILRRLSAARS
jgi:hypothetical protein